MATQGASAVQPRSAWAGWSVFAGVALLVAGIAHVINALMAFTRTGTTVLVPSGVLVQFNYAGLGWTFLITGVVLAATGAGILSGRTWARVVGVALAVLSVLANTVLFAAYPMWSGLIILIDLFVIYSLAAHGRELHHTN